MSSPTRRVLPPLSALLAFERAAARLSFKLAAQDLALSPSAISHQIRNLEDRLGVQLFSRDGQLSLTPTGQSYYESASAALAGLQDATRALMERHDNASWDLRVGVTPYLSSALLLPALSDLRERARIGRLHLETYSPDLEFERSGLDVVIRLGRHGLSGLKQFPLLEVSALPVCAPSRAAQVRTYEDLAAQTLIHNSRQPGGWAECLGAFGVSRAAGERDIWVDSGLAAVDAAEHGLGVALAMYPLIASEPRFGQTLAAPFPPPVAPPQTVVLACRPERADERPILAFRNWLQRTIARVVASAETALDHGE